MKGKLLDIGAEASLFLQKDVIVKERIPKAYRIPEIDNRLRGYRTRREAKVLSKLQALGFPAPKLLWQDEQHTIRMGYIAGKKLRDVLDKNNYRKFARELGERIAQLHNETIIHGDLTTSNMIVHSKNKRVYFIDFGLSFFSHKPEDKAVDLHLLKEGLESKHHKIWERAFKEACEAYRKKAIDSDAVLKRLEQVEKRGRYKKKGMI